MQSALPSWSPDGKWILYYSSKNKWSIVSYDGREEQVIRDTEAEQLTFSKDSSRLYGIRRGADRETELFAVDLASKAVRKIGTASAELYPQSPLNPGVRLSLSPDGKRILYPTFRQSSSLWMVEGFVQPGWRGRLGL